jgi:hypothetical protein
MMVLMLYTAAVYVLGVCTVLQMTSKVGLLQEIKQLLSDFVRHKLGL